MTQQAYLGLGANLADPEQQLQEALARLTRHEGIELLACSSFYRSRPLGPQDQDDFINAVCRISTSLSPLDLLDRLQAIEQAQGRQRSRPWGPRTLDIDLLFYADLVLHSERLTLPHPLIAERAFVLYPLRELLPDGCLPDGRRLDELEPAVRGQSIYPWPQPD